MEALADLAEATRARQLARLRAYLGGGTPTGVDQEALEESFSEAWELVLALVGGHKVPESVEMRAVREVASELYHRRAAPGGVMPSFSDMAAPVRFARDPALGAYPILRPFIPGGFA